MAHFSGKCPICLGEFVPEQISALRCGHTFHYECILQWLKTSKTCPECRSSTNERNLIRQLFFNIGDISQLVDTDSPVDEKALLQKVSDIKQALLCEQKAHAKTAEKLHALKKQKEKSDALCIEEKRKVKNLTSQIARVQQIELMLQDQQDLQKKLERYKARLKATELYSLLVGTSGAMDDSKIDKYLSQNGDPDVQKFLDLMKRQYEDVKKKLMDVKEQLEVSQKTNLELRMKLDKHKKLNVAFREELAGLSGATSQTVTNTRLKDVLEYSPEDSRPSFGFDFVEDSIFSPSVMKSAFKARSRPVLRPIAKQSEKCPLSPLSFNEDFPGPSEQHDGGSETGSSSKWDVKIAKPIPDPANYFPKNKYSSLGGSKKTSSRSTGEINCKRNFSISSSKTIKKQKSGNKVPPVPILNFFSKKGSSNSGVTQILDESVILLD